MLIPNGVIRVLDPAGRQIPGFDRRTVQMVQSEVTEDAGMVEIVAGGSSAMAPVLTMQVLDFPTTPVLPEVPLTTGAYSDPRWGPVTSATGMSDPDDNYMGSPIGYARDGFVYVLEQWGHYGGTLITPGPWHILRAQAPPGLTFEVAIRLARVDFLTQTATWYQHISMDMPGAFRTAAWQPDLQQLLDTGDGSFGIGAGLVQGASTYLGYLPGVRVQLGLNEYAEQIESQELGLVDAEHPVLVYERPLAFGKFDIIALADGRRLLVSDLTHRFQRLGVTLAILQMTERWLPDGLIYNPAIGQPYLGA